MNVSRIALMAAIAFAAVSPLGAQDHDPTTAVKGTGLPAGWMVRFDPAYPGRPTPTVADVNFRVMGPGFHHTSGPAGIYYKEADASKGNYTVSATFGQRKSSQHEAYGLFIGGKDLQTATQNYLYFIVKPVDGTFLINHRTSDGKPKSVVAYTASDAINKDSPTDGSATNKLSIKVSGDVVSFMVNDKEVKSLKKSELDGASTDGLVGMRLNHNLDLHIADFGVKH
ncbi:MAG: hypothetical protein V4558_08715 [Gemmatimonadota bacterium]